MLFELIHIFATHPFLFKREEAKYSFGQAQRFNPDPRATIHRHLQRSANEMHKPDPALAKADIRGAGVWVLFDGVPNTLLQDEPTKGLKNTNPGGDVDFGEDSSPLDTALRELNEETGGQITHKDAISVIDYDEFLGKDGKKSIIYFVVVENKLYSLRSMANQESSNHKIVPIDDILSGKITLAHPLKPHFRTYQILKNYSDLYKPEVGAGYEAKGKAPMREREAIPYGGYGEKRYGHQEEEPQYGYKGKNFIPGYGKSEEEPKRFGYQGKHFVERYQGREEQAYSAPVIEMPRGDLNTVGEYLNFLGIEKGHQDKILKLFTNPKHEFNKEYAQAAKIENVDALLNKISQALNNNDRQPMSDRYVNALALETLLKKIKQKGKALKLDNESDLLQNVSKGVHKQVQINLSYQYIPD